MTKALCSSAALATLFLAGGNLVACSKPAASPASNAPAAAAISSSQPANATVASPAAASPGGPDILSTTADAGDKTPTDVHAQFGHFQIMPVDGTDTLMVDGKPATYTEEGGSSPEPIAANNSLTLVGVFELQHESVAWVVIGGGSACAGTHILVPVGETRSVEGLPIKGCDDRGTMRKSGDRIIYDAGGSSGVYDHGRLVAG